MPKVNPEILVWARETAGLSPEEAARKVAPGKSGLRRLHELEAGEREPSRSTLLKMAEKYRRPLIAFYMTRPPESSDRGMDFRTLPDEPQPGTEAMLSALLRDVRVRQDLVKAALEEAEEADALAFVDAGSIRDGVELAVASLHQILGIDRQAFREERSLIDAFKLLRLATERAGVFVLLLGNLGSYHTALDVGVFRGFALADKVAPFIVVNENDARAAWSFTLLHELVHIWLGQTGVSGYGSEAEVEKFCDSVAASFLLTPDEILNLSRQITRDPAADALMIGEFAGSRNLSRKMVAYNLYRLNSITDAHYRSLCRIFDDERAALAQVAQQDGGPDYYVVRRHRLGDGLVQVVSRMLRAQTLSTTEAARVLGVKASNVSRLVGWDTGPTTEGHARGRA